MLSVPPRILLACLLTCSTVLGFAPMSSSSNQSSRTTALFSTSEDTSLMMKALYNPAARNAKYGKNNIAQYLVDLHDNKAIFNFCGGMMFQLVLTDALREHLVSTKDQPVIFPADMRRMSATPDYSKSANADNIQYFHGREVRQVQNAEGGMGLVLQLSLADGEDPQGWTRAEIDGYDGWGHDSGRDWRTGVRQVEEGYKSFQEDFGKNAFTLHHRFYLHFDQGDNMWLSAEDGCEGTPQAQEKNIFSAMKGLFQ